MDKKEKMKIVVMDTGKKAKGLMEHVVHAVDQNEDGKFDLKDISIVGAAVGQAVKKGTQTLKNGMDEKKRAMDLKLLQPIFTADLAAASFFLPKFIRITERDKKHAESEVCQGSIGYCSDQKGLHIVHIFRDAVSAYGLSFYPDCDSEFYYVNPSDRKDYIALDEYFGFLKIARISELQKIAQDLGAKHFRVTYKEEQKTFSEQKIKANAETKADAKINGQGVAERASTEKKYSNVEIASEMTFPGHDPVQPTLKYLKRDSTVQNLVKLRMNPTGPLLHQHLTINLSQSSGIKEGDAMKIDAVLKGMKVSGNTTVASEVQNEARRYLEYEIDF